MESVRRRVDSQADVKGSAPFASINDLIAKLDGRKVVQKILIANNGIGAVKAIRSIRRWAYETFGNEREVKFILWCIMTTSGVPYT